MDSLTVGAPVAEGKSSGSVPALPGSGRIESGAGSLFGRYCSVVPNANLFDRLRQRGHDSIGPCAPKAFFGFVEVAGKSPNTSKDPDLRQVYSDALA